MAAITEKGLIGRKDKLLTFGETNTLAATGDAPCGYSAGSTDGTVVDMGTGKTSLAGMAVAFTVKEAVTGTGTVTGTFFVAVSDDKSTWTKIAASAAVGSAELTADAVFKVAIPHGAKEGRYVKAGVTLAGSSITGGKVEATVDTFAGV